MQHFKVKFWNWGPLTIRNNNMTCVHFFLANNHSTLPYTLFPKASECI